MNTKFQIVRETKNASADARKTLGSFYADSRTRYNFASGSKKADIVYSAIDPDAQHIASVFAEMPFASLDTIEDVDFSELQLDEYDILRKYDDPDAQLKSVNRDTIYSTSEYAFGDSFNVKVVGEWWKTDKKGRTKKRGERLECWFNDDTEDAFKLDVSIDAHGRIAPKQYGIGAAWTLAKTILDEHATTLAMDARIRTHMYTQVNLVLERVASGNSLQRTQQ